MKPNPRNTKPELSQAAIDRALKLAAIMDAYEAVPKEAPYELLVEFCEVLNIVAEAAPLDLAIKWPDLKQITFPDDASSRLTRFQSAYFGPGIEATRWKDHEPKWLALVSERVMERCIDS